MRGVDAIAWKPHEAELGVRFDARLYTATVPVLSYVLTIKIKKQDHKMKFAQGNA